MKRFFDSSSLVPVFYGDQVRHKASLAMIIRFDKSSGCCGAHSLAEVYSTLTRMPGKHRISAEYADTLKRSAALGIVGCGIYDAVLAHCAIKAKAESIYTWNTRHHDLCGPQVTGLPRIP